MMMVVGSPGTPPRIPPGRTWWGFIKLSVLDLGTTLSLVLGDCSPAVFSCCPVVPAVLSKRGHEVFDWLPHRPVPLWQHLSTATATQRHRPSGTHPPSTFLKELSIKVSALESEILYEDFGSKDHKT